MELEQAIVDSLSTLDLHQNSLFSAMAFVDHDPRNTVGCAAHSGTVTRQVIKYHLIMRMYFATERR